MHMFILKESFEKHIFIRKKKLVPKVSKKNSGRKKFGSKNIWIQKIWVHKNVASNQIQSKNFVKKKLMKKGQMFPGQMSLGQLGPVKSTFKVCSKSVEHQLTFSLWSMSKQLCGLECGRVGSAQVCKSILLLIICLATFQIIHSVSFLG